MTTAGMTAAAAMDTAAATEKEKENYLIPRFGALCFFLAALEAVIPKPLPFLRLGLSNIPLIAAAGFFPPKAYFLLALVKILAQGITGGTFFSWLFLFSLAGTFASASLMFLMKQMLKSRISAVGISTAGAFASTCIQILIARLWIFGEAASAIAPLLLAAGTAAGFAMGVFAELFIRNSQWLKETIAKTESGAFPPAARRAVLRTAAGLCAAAAAGAADSVYVRAGIFCVFFAASFRNKNSRQKLNILPVLFSLAAITAFNLYPPRGRILFQPAGFPIASESLAAGAARAFLFESLLFISRWTFTPERFRFSLPEHGRFRIISLTNVRALERHIGTAKGKPSRNRRKTRFRKTAHERTRACFAHRWTAAEARRRAGPRADTAGTAHRQYVCAVKIRIQDSGRAAASGAGRDANTVCSTAETSCRCPSLDNPSVSTGG